MSVDVSTDEMKPWKTERARFETEDIILTVHWTGQMWATRKSDGVLIKYHETSCSFGCLRIS